MTSFNSFPLCIFFSLFFLVRLIVTSYFFSFLAFDTLELESSLVLFPLSPSPILSFFTEALSSETKKKTERERVMSSTLIRVERENQTFFLSPWDRTALEKNPDVVIGRRKKLLSRWKTRESVDDQESFCKLFFNHTEMRNCFKVSSFFCPSAH